MTFSCRMPQDKKDICKTEKYQASRTASWYKVRGALGGVVGLVLSINSSSPKQTLTTRTKYPPSTNNNTHNDVIQHISNLPDLFK